MASCPSPDDVIMIPSPYFWWRELCSTPLGWCFHLMWQNLVPLEPSNLPDVLNLNFQPGYYTAQPGWQNFTKSLHVDCTLALMLNTSFLSVYFYVIRGRIANYIALELHLCKGRMWGWRGGGGSQVGLNGALAWMSLLWACGSIIQQLLCGPVQPSHYMEVLSDRQEQTGWQNLRRVRLLYNLNFHTTFSTFKLFFRNNFPTSKAHGVVEFEFCVCVSKSVGVWMPCKTDSHSGALYKDLLLGTLFVSPLTSCICHFTHGQRVGSSWKTWRGSRREVKG